MSDSCNIDKAFMIKALCLIASGLKEKEVLLSKHPGNFPNSGNLRHGISMFLTASLCMSKDPEKVLSFSDESTFLKEYITKPINQWLSDWDQDKIAAYGLYSDIWQEDWVMAYRKEENVYFSTAECTEFLKSQDNDYMDGTDERLLYDIMSHLSQSEYVYTRRFIIEHPIITDIEFRIFKLSISNFTETTKALNFAYEEIDEVCYRCPVCGWTMTKGKYGYQCCSHDCTRSEPHITKDMKINDSKNKFLRLKRGIMKYIALPGKIELKIEEFCKTQRLNYSLWPYMDQFDIEIRFEDGTVWEIDAKAYHHPVLLKYAVEKDEAFLKVPFEKGFYVIPDEFTNFKSNYTSIVNRSLNNTVNKSLGKEGKVSCITFSDLQQKIIHKERCLHENRK